MKVKKFMSMMMRTSTINTISLRVYGSEIKSVSKAAAMNGDLFSCEDKTILTFEIYGDKLVLNLKPEA